VDLQEGFDISGTGKQDQTVDFVIVDIGQIVPVEFGFPRWNGRGRLQAEQRVFGIAQAVSTRQIGLGPQVLALPGIVRKADQIAPGITPAPIDPSSRHIKTGNRRDHPRLFRLVPAQGLD
jgi:hypothetical protein